MKRTVAKELDEDQITTLANYMSHDIERAMAHSPASGWFRECGMAEFHRRHGGLEEIRDREGNRIGEGIETLECLFVLNGETEEGFEEAFERARKKAWREMESRDIRYRLGLGV